MTAVTLPATTGHWGHGFCDLGASIRFPRAPDEEGVSDLVRAARAGGVATVVVDVRGQPPIDNARFQAACAALAGGHGVRIVPAVCPVQGGGLADVASIERPTAWSTSPAERNEHRPTSSWLIPDEVRFVYKLPGPVDDAVLLRRVAETARARHALIITPSHDGALAQGAVAVEGAVATRLGLPAMPEAAEVIGVSRILAIAQLTGARFHVAGVFTAAGAALLAASGNERVSGSVFAPHLLLDDTALLARRYDTRYLRQPPLPTSSSRLALLDAVKAGTLCIASGHVHVPRRERDLEPTRATPGGTALASTARLLRPLLGDEVLARAFGSAPAQFLGDTHTPLRPPPSPRDDDDNDTHGAREGRGKSQAYSSTNVDDLARCVEDLSR
jgi:dihydroorotase